MNSPNTYRYLADTLALRIIKEHPDYHLFENNCQNFAKYLLESLCPSVSIPETIQNILERLQDFSTQISLPGAYPPSSISTYETSFVTASETTWVTASGNTWLTAAECLSFSDANSILYEENFVSPSIDPV